MNDMFAKLHFLTLIRQVAVKFASLYQLKFNTDFLLLFSRNWLLLTGIQPQTNVSFNFNRLL